MLSSESTETHHYTYAGGKLLRETITETGKDKTVTTYTLDFRYDAQGVPYSLIVTTQGVSQTYYYITNLQGDVMYIVDESGDEVASYDYDPYGKLLRTTGDFAETNPIRYRGYYYDTDTDFYYLQSRYYDPTICRFINADGYTSTSQNIVSYNMYTYCGNDPINAIDPSGHIPNRAVMMTDGSTISDYSRAWANKALTELEERRKQEQREKIKEKIVGVGKAFWNSLDCYVGAGQGVYGEIDVLGFGVEAGFRGDYIAVHLKDGEFTAGQEVYVGATGTAVVYDIGIAGYEFTPYNGEPESDEWIFYDKHQDSITIFGASGYFLYFGGTINIGFNPINFCEELWEVFYG